MRLEDIEEGERLLAAYHDAMGRRASVDVKATKSDVDSWFHQHAPELIAAAKAAAWRPISEATPFDRVLVSGGQKPHGTVAGYWWWHEDDLDASGIPLGHPNATHWRPIGPLPGDQS